MSELLLFSAGLDSFPAWHYLHHPPALYFDLGHRYADQERAAIATLAGACGIDVTISDELRLGRWEADDAIIPMRNVHLAMLAANRADTVWCIGVKGDNTLDKSPQAFADMSSFITRLRGRQVRVDSPFWQLTKTEIVAWYLAQGLPTAHLLLTFSCSRTDGEPTHCGACPSACAAGSPWSTTVSPRSSTRRRGSGRGSGSTTCRRCETATTRPTASRNSSLPSPSSAAPSH